MCGRLLLTPIITCLSKAGSKSSHCTVQLRAMTSVKIEMVDEQGSYSDVIHDACTEESLEVLDQGKITQDHSSLLTEQQLAVCGANPNGSREPSIDGIHSNFMNSHARVSVKELPHHIHEMVTFGHPSSHQDQSHVHEDRSSCPECSHTRNGAEINNQRLTKISSDDKPHYCVECSKNFKLVSQLKIHERIHKNERPYVCEFCQKGFKQPSNLTQHRRIHTGERPYRCSYCEKTFKQKSQVMQHERLHTGSKPYICKQCQRGFVQLSQLQSHEKTHRDRAARLAKKARIQVSKAELRVDMVPEEIINPVILS